MRERNEQMAAMLAADAPAARDLAFEIAVLARIEQRRFRRGVALNVALALGGAILLALVMPEIQSAWQAQVAGNISNVAIAALLFALVLPVQWRMVRRT